MSAPDENSEWRFSLDEVGDDAESEDGLLEPGRVSGENVLFVVLGVLFALFVIWRAVGPAG
ncbi:hypothetical protein ACFQH6_05435 [Halobacteriaceae archaeon GCM10025711]